MKNSLNNVQGQSSVQKMLSPEETSLLQDVAAGLQVLLNSNNAGSPEESVEGTGAQGVEMSAGASAGSEAMKQGDPKDMETSDDYDEAKKSNDGPTANDKAEERTEDGTLLTEDNLASVAKMLSLIGKKAPVQKSQDTDASAVAGIVLKALEPVLNKVNTVEKDMNAMLEALGISEAMETVEKSQNPMEKVEKSVQGYNNSTPVTNPDTMDLIKMVAVSVAQELTKEQSVVDDTPKANYSTANSRAHKSLGEAVAAVHKGA